MEINTLLNDHWVKEEIKQEIRKHHEKNENTLYQNSWDTVKALEKSAMLTHFKKEGKSQKT